MNTNISDDDMQNKLDELREVYQNPFMPHKYPNCTLAIQCLYVKFHFLTGNRHLLELSLKQVIDNLYRVKDNVMFDDCYYFTVYLSALRYINEKRYSRFVILAEDMIGGEQEIEAKDDKMKCYYYYIWCLKLFYSNTLTTKNLYQSRIYYNSLDERSFWVICDNILLSIIHHIQKGDFDLIDNEVNFLKRQLKKYDNSSNILDELKRLIKGIRAYEKNKNAVSLKKHFNTFKANSDLMRLVDLEYINDFSNDIK